MRIAQAQPGVAAVYDKETAAARFGLPLDREGDVAVLGDAGTCIGGRESEHDLTGLAGHRLRSHGGVSEAKVPFILNRPLNPRYAARAAEGGLRNFHVFEFAINGVDA
jgi:phosphonoacetate hydrolase